MKLLVMNQWIPRAAKADAPVLALQKLAEKETFLRPKSKADNPLKSLPRNFDDFIRLAHLKSPYGTLYGFPSSLFFGDVCLIGGLAIAALQAEDIASSFRHPSYPWRRHVDILLIGGALKKEDLHHQLNAAVLPSLIFFSGGEEASMEQIRKSSETTRIIDLGGEKGRFFEIEYDPADKSDTLALTQYRLGLLGKRRLLQERFALSKHSKILSFLRERCLRAVTEQLDSYLAQEEGDEERAIGAWLPAEDVVTAVAEYLVFLDRRADAPGGEREKMLRRIFEEHIQKINHELSETIDAQVEKIAQRNMKAFALYLEAWGLREEQKNSSPFGVYR